MQRGGLAPWQSRRVASYVADNLGTRIRTTDLAEVAQLSASHFTRAFKETFGETPLGYVSRQRMRYAQDLMLRSGECLSQIALTCGHCDQSHFTRVFRRKVGMSPRRVAPPVRQQRATAAGVQLRLLAGAQLRKYVAEPVNLGHRVVMNQRDARDARLDRQAQAPHQARRIHMAVADPDVGASQGFGDSLR